MPLLPRVCTTEELGPLIRARLVSPRAVAALLLGGALLVGWPAPGRADPPVTGHGDAPHLEPTRLLQDGDGLALNARQENLPPVDALKPGRFALELIDLPSGFTAGQISKVRIKVFNTDADHKPLDGHQLWIDLKLVDARGREFLRRGQIRARKAVAEFGFVVPADAVGPITVRADLNYRAGQRGPADLSAESGKPAGDITRVASAVDQVPLSRIQATAAEQMERLLLLLALGRSR